MKLLVLGICLISTLVGCGGGGGSSTPVALASTSNTPLVTNKNCQANGLISSDNYIASNSSHLFGTTAQGTSCVSITSQSNTISSDFTYDYSSADPTNQAVTFISVIYGNKPGITSGNNKLPTTLASINNAIVTYDISSKIDNTGGGSLFFDINLTVTNSPTNMQPIGGTTVNLDITLNSWGTYISDPNFQNVWRKDLLNLPIVTIGGVQYYYQVDGIYNVNSKLPISFTRVDFISYPNASTSINIKPFLAYLVSNNVIPNNLYLSNIEFGAEIAYGKGDIKLSNYNVSVN
jgi:hypothetical protein